MESISAAATMGVTTLSKLGTEVALACVIKETRIHHHAVNHARHLCLQRELKDALSLLVFFWLLGSAHSLLEIGS